MKKTILSLSLSLLCLGFSLHASENQPVDKDVPTHFIPAPDLVKIKAEDAINDKQGKLYRVGVATYTNLTTANSGLWTTLSSGDKKWQLIIKNPGAEALSFIFSTFKLSGGSTFYVETKEGEKVSDVLTTSDQLEDFQQNIALCFGDELVLTLTEPAYASASEIVLNRVMYNYRSTGNPKVEKINESEACEINVNCSEGNNYQDEKKGVARIYIVEGNTAAFCSGSLVNNHAQNCKPLFLTALHCGVSTSASDMNVWKFYFRYEAPTCTNPTSTGTLASHYINGCVRLADSADNGGNTGSDFLLVQLGTIANETTTIGKLTSSEYDAYWNGWDANTTATTGGAGIHHPKGDIKKISTFNGSTISTTYGGSVSGTHWRLSWSATANGQGVTEGGSSGSPLFRYNGGDSKIIGTLTGGSSYCNTPTSPDYYGKLSFHWQSNGTPTDERLKTFLDPNGTGVLTMSGSANPCNFIGMKELKEVKSSVKLYPNPTSDKLSVDLSSLIEEVTIEIYDMAGKLISTTTHNAGTTVELDMKAMNSGLYQVHVVSNEIRSIQRISKI